MTKPLRKLGKQEHFLNLIQNYHGPNALIKRHRVADWTIKEEPTICSLWETHFKEKDTYRLKVRGWKKVFHGNGNGKKGGVAILIYNNRNLLSQNVNAITFILLFTFIRFSTVSCWFFCTSESCFKTQEVGYLETLYRIAIIDLRAVIFQIRYQLSACSSCIYLIYLCLCFSSGKWWFYLLLLLRRVALRMH